MVTKETRNRLSSRLGDRVPVKPIEGHEHVPASGAKYATRLGVCADLLVKEHDAKQAEDDIERIALEWQVLRVRSLKRDAVRAKMLRGELNDGWVDVRGEDVRVRQRLIDGTSANSGAGRSLQNPSRPKGGRR